MLQTKSIAVIYTLVMDRKHYVAETCVSNIEGSHKVLRYNPDPHHAKEFANEVEAKAFIPKIINPSGRAFIAGSETIDVGKQQRQKSRKEALT